MQDVELPFGNDPSHAWVVRNFLTTEQICKLQISIEVLEKEIPYGEPSNVSMPFAKAIAPGKLGGWAAKELPPSGIHVARNLEASQSSDPSIGQVRQLACEFGNHFFGHPMQTFVFTRPVGNAQPGLAGHADIHSGFINLFLAGEKSFDLLPTLVRHQFGDGFVTDDNLLQYADPRFEKVSLHLKPGDLLYSGSHVLHWVGNESGATQHLQLIYPDYRRLDKIFEVMMTHQALDRLSPATSDMLSAIATEPFAPQYSSAVYLKHMYAQDAVLADLLSQGIFESPWQDHACILANPDSVTAALSQYLP